MKRETKYVFRCQHYILLLLATILLATRFFLMSRSMFDHQVKSEQLLLLYSLAKKVLDDSFSQFDRRLGSFTYTDGIFFDERGKQTIMMITWV